MSDHQPNGEDQVLQTGGPTGSDSLGSGADAGSEPAPYDYVIRHPRAEAIKEQVGRLREALAESDLRDYRRRDALQDLEHLVNVLQQEKDVRREGYLPYALNKIAFIGREDERVVAFARSLGELLDVQVE